MRKVVANTTPLIALTNTGHLNEPSPGALRRDSDSAGGDG